MPKEPGRGIANYSTKCYRTIASEWPTIHPCVLAEAIIVAYLGEGDFVLVVTVGTFGDRNTSFYDLFRVQSGKIVEHWDVVEEVQQSQDQKTQTASFENRNNALPENLATTQQRKLFSLS
jgi:predicted SnoaL-like aldol condensation-catalyzing enzyme